MFKYPPTPWFKPKIRSLNKEDYGQWLYNPERLEEKMRIFNNFTKFSIESQTYDNYEWIFYISKKLPKQYKEELAKIKKSKIIVIKNYEDIKNVSLFNDQEEFISIRLDDDDGLHPTYFEKIKDFNTPNEIIAPFYGLYFNLLNDNTSIIAHEVNNNQYIKGCGVGAYNQSIYSYGNHAKMNTAYKVNYINDKNMFFISVHDHTVTDRKFINNKITKYNINELFNNY
jgi:hypothetical protein